MTDRWKMHNGDSIEMMDEIEDESVGLSLFSPPFPGMYAYTDSPRDVGNSKDLDELVAHFSFLIPGLYRVTMPGRSCAIHLTQQVAFKGTDGFTRPPGLPGPGHIRDAGGRVDLLWRSHDREGPTAKGREDQRPRPDVQEPRHRRGEDAHGAR